MAKQQRIGNNPLAWITSTVAPAPATSAAAEPAAAAPKPPVPHEPAAEQAVPAPEQMERHAADPAYLIVMTAKTEEALFQKLQDLVDWLRGEGAQHELKDMAFTLLVGRSHFNVRAALVVRSREELQEALQASLAKGQARHFFLQTAKPVKPDPQSLLYGKGLLAELAGQAPEAEAAYEQKLLALAEMFVSRYALDWADLYAKAEGRRIPMPVYPFARERCWVPCGDAVGAASAAKSAHPGPSSRISPLIERNTSTIHGLRFTTLLRGNEYYLSESVGTNRFLAGALLPEMARTAGELAAERMVLRIQQLVWSKPRAVAPKESLHIQLFPLGHGTANALAFEAVTGEEAVIHCQGSLLFAAAEDTRAPERVDLSAVRERCRHHSSGAEHYRQIRQAGFMFGPDLQSILTWQGGEQEALALLELPGALLADAGEYVLHPALLEGAFETAWRLIGERDVAATWLRWPYSVREIVIRQRLGRRCYAYASYVEGKLCIQCLDDSGVVLAEIKDLIGKLIAAGSGLLTEKHTSMVSGK